MTVLAWNALWPGTEPARLNPEIAPLPPHPTPITFKPVVAFLLRNQSFPKRDGVNLLTAFAVSHTPEAASFRTTTVPLSGNRTVSGLLLKGR